MTKPANSPGTSSSTPLRIFLLDDNAIDRETCRRHLARVENVFYEFVEHNSVDGAIELVLQHQPDCILLDYHLHDGTGLQFLQTLTTVGGPRTFPVVMLTGTGNERIAVEVMKIGAQDYLSKDHLNPELLQRAIEGAIYRANTERLLEAQRVEMERLFKEAQMANARKDQFLATLSHELRTPLTPVLAAVSQADFTEFTHQDMLETFAMIRRNVEVEARLIDDLLDLTRITSGKLQIHTRAVDVQEVLRHAAESCEAERKAKNIRLEWRLSAEAMPLHADPARIQQVFWNILKNAVKFTPKDGAITVTTRKSGEQMEIEVADTGIGLPEGSVEKIFDAFEQGDSEVTRKFGGLGLGLAISQALVVAHGGSIAAANVPEGTGAVFTVSLPLGVEPGGHDADAPVPQATTASVSAGATVLLVEDHEDSAAVIRRILTARGYQVHVAPNGRKALELFKAYPINCIVSDLGLPDITGLELMKQISAIRQVPAVAVSGYGLDSDIQKSMAAGFTQHITKPVDVQQLLQVLQTLNA
ncbi:MAG: response regulator [Verrucomicrobiota bacterium]